MKKILALTLVVACLAGGCAFKLENSRLESTGTEETGTASSEAPSDAVTVPVLATEPTEPPALDVPETLLGEMTLEAKVGQLFFLRPWNATSLDSSVAELLAAYQPGGILFFGDNLDTPEKLSEFCAALQGASKIGLFLGVDEEGGRVARLGNHPNFPVPKVGSMASVGAAGDPAEARSAGHTIGGYLAPFGINVDFAPVSDVNTNPQNLVIGDRAFGSDPELVAQMVSAFLDGLHAQGIAGSIKHFPGHGDTVGDTHTGFVSIQKDWNALKECELIPFVANLDKTDMVMVAHITCPGVTEDGYPASLSYEMVTNRLRRELGYQGVVITDGLEMRAIANQYGAGEAAVLAIQAGVDILLLPGDVEAAYHGVLQAVQSGEISQERLNESVLRILRLKEAYGIL